MDVADMANANFQRVRATAKRDGQGLAVNNAHVGNMVLAMQQIQLNVFVTQHGQGKNAIYL